MAKVDARTYYAIKNSLTTVEKELIEFYEREWFLRHKVPTVEEVATELNIKHTAVNYYLLRPPVKAGLKKRGIPYEQHSRENLTATQVAVAITMSNFADTRPNEVKLDQMGVNPSQYYAWLNDPQFKEMVEQLADQNMNNIRPTAIGELTKKINSGDWNAVKFYLETTGALTNNDAPQSEHLIKMFVEIIQKHVKDPEIIMAIAQDVKLAAANRTLEVVTTPPAITAEVVHDEELEKAKRMLGV